MFFIQQKKKKNPSKNQRGKKNNNTIILYFVLANQRITYTYMYWNPKSYDPKGRGIHKESMSFSS